MCLLLQSNPRSLQGLLNSAMQESGTDIIIMDHFQPKTVRRLVQFLYNGDYDDHEDEHEAPDQNTCNGDEIEEGRKVDSIS